MPSRKIDRNLLDQKSSKPSGLAAEFGRSVLSRAKQMKAAMIRHRRILMISSAVAVGLAALVSVKVGRKVEVIPPPLDGFRAPEFTLFRSGE